MNSEKAKFQRLMEEARRQLARHYLLHSSLELKGYGDAKSFPQRFTNGEGISLGDWPAAHRFPESASVT